MFNALVVLYNKKCENSITLTKLLEYKEKLNIIIFDNSTNSDYINNNKEFSEKYKIKYYSQNKNIGLSKAYNYIIKRKDILTGDYIIILDDDTILTDSYFQELFSLDISKFDIVLPKVISNDSMISPCKVINDCRICKINLEEKINQYKLSAINSGMIIKLSVYDQMLYNEELFLDYVDHDFMRQIRKNNSEIFVMNSSIFQNFSRDQVNSIDSEIFRFKIFKKDYKKYCLNCGKRFFYYLSITRYKIKKCIKYKTLKFLWL